MSTLTKRMVSPRDGRQSSPGGERFRSNDNKGDHDQTPPPFGTLLPGNNIGNNNGHDNGNNSKSSLSCSLTPSTPISSATKYIVTPRKSIRARCGHKTSISAVDFVCRIKGETNPFLKPMSDILTKCQRIFFSYLHFSQIYRRLLTYCLLIIIIGLIKDYVLVDTVLPTAVLDFIFTYLKTPKKFFLNVYFVKLGWLWTGVALLPYFIFTRFMAAKRNQSKENGEPVLLVYLKELSKPLTRFVLATLIWYISTDIFVYISIITGHCQDKNNTLVFLSKERPVCLREGNRWIPGFDISGHIFLMTFSNLIIIDELRYLIFKFEEFHEYLYFAKFQRERIQNIVQPYQFQFTPIHVIGLICTFISFAIVLIWDFMMVQTMFFYHDVLQKLLGFAWAFASWFLLYRTPGSNLLSVVS